MFTELYFETDLTEKHRRRRLFIKSLVAIWDPEVRSLYFFCFLKYQFQLQFIHCCCCCCCKLVLIETMWFSFPVKCLNCQAVSDTFEPFLHILLDIKVIVFTLQTAFNATDDVSINSDKKKSKSKKPKNRQLDVFSFHAVCFRCSKRSRAVCETRSSGWTQCLQLWQVLILVKKNTQQRPKWRAGGFILMPQRSLQMFVHLSCNNVVTATKGLSIHRSTNVLTLVLKRFDIFTGGKISKVTATPLSALTENTCVSGQNVILCLLSRMSDIQSTWTCIPSWVKSTNVLWSTDCMLF